MGKGIRYSDEFKQEALDQIAAQLNSRPRKTLDFRTPKQLIEKSVALTS